MHLTAGSLREPSARFVLETLKEYDVIDLKLWHVYSEPGFGETRRLLFVGLYFVLLLRVYFPLRCLQFDT